MTKSAGAKPGLTAADLAAKLPRGDGVENEDRIQEIARLRRRLSNLGAQQAALDPKRRRSRIDWRCEATSRKSEPALDILLERMAIAREIKTIDDQLRALNADLDR
jgi:ABC-type phosphate transport system auxiliary subunit